MTAVRRIHLDASALRDVWVALRFNIRAVLEQVTLADLAADKLPAGVKRIVAKPEAWE